MQNLQKTTLDMSYKCQWFVTKMSQKVPDSSWCRIPIWGSLMQSCDTLVTSHWHMCDMSNVFFWRFCIQLKKTVKSLWQPCDSPVTCSKVTCHRHVTKIDFYEIDPQSPKNISWHVTHVTEMSQKSSWLSFGGEFLLKNSEFPSSFPLWGTLLSL